MTVAAARGADDDPVGDASHCAAPRREAGVARDRVVDDATADAPRVRHGPASVPDVDDDLDLDRRAERQRRDADRRAGVHPGIPEHRAEELDWRR